MRQQGGQASRPRPAAVAARTCMGFSHTHARKRTATKRSAAFTHKSGWVSQHAQRRQQASRRQLVGGDGECPPPSCGITLAPPRSVLSCATPAAAEAAAGGSAALLPRRWLSTPDQGLPGTGCRRWRCQGGVAAASAAAAHRGSAPGLHTDSKSTQSGEASRDARRGANTQEQLSSRAPAPSCERGPQLGGGCDGTGRRRRVAGGGGQNGLPPLPAGAATLGTARQRTTEPWPGAPATH